MRVGKTKKEEEWMGVGRWRWGFAGYSQWKLREGSKECDGMWVVRQKGGLARVLWGRVKHRVAGWVGKSGKVEVECGIADGRTVRHGGEIFWLGSAFLLDFDGERHGSPGRILRFRGCLLR